MTMTYQDKDGGMKTETSIIKTLTDTQLVVIDTLENKQVEMEFKRVNP
jgi:hypothetical protein